MAIYVGDGAEHGGTGLVLPGDASRLGIYTIDYTVATPYIDGVIDQDGRSIDGSGWVARVGRGVDQRGAGHDVPLLLEGLPIEGHYPTVLCTHDDEVFSN